MTLLTGRLQPMSRGDLIDHRRDRSPTRRHRPARVGDQAAFFYVPARSPPGSGADGGPNRSAAASPRASSRLAKLGIIRSMPVSAKTRRTRRRRDRQQHLALLLQRTACAAARTWLADASQNRVRVMSTTNHLYSCWPRQQSQPQAGGVGHIDFPGSLHHRHAPGHRNAKPGLGHIFTSTARQHGYRLRAQVPVQRRSCGRRGRGLGTQYSGSAADRMTVNINLRKISCSFSREMYNHDA